MTASSASVLVAEDDPNILVSLQFLLSNAQYAVTTADNGAQAWDALARQRYDLAVLDIMLPEIDGLELCRRIRAARDMSRMRILMLSARGRDTEVQAGLALGADAYMTKPFGTREFLEEVARLTALQRAP